VFGSPQANILNVLERISFFSASTRILEVIVNVDGVMGIGREGFAINSLCSSNGGERNVA
jgi:hypothetical protein